MKHKTQFKVTIQPHDEYIVKRARHKVLNTEMYLLYDGENLLFSAFPRTFVEFVEDMTGNECATLLEVFEDKNRRLWAYWIDAEIDEDYLTPLPVAYMY